MGGRKSSSRRKSTKKKRPRVSSKVEKLITDEAFLPSNITCGATRIGGGIDPYPNKVNEVLHNKGGQDDVSLNTANSGSEDLETALRRKALENLRKFRKELQDNVKSSAKGNKSDSDVTPLSTAKTEDASHKSAQQENRDGVALTQVIRCRSEVICNEDFSHSTKTEINAPVGENDGKKSGDTRQSALQPADAWEGALKPADTRQSASRPADRSAVSPSPQKDNHNAEPAFTDELGPGKPSCSTTVQVYPKETLLASKRNRIKTVPVRSVAVSAGTSDNLATGAVNDGICPAVETNSSVTSTSEGHTSTRHQEETKEGSQFEQKTMSVMRGGEMVQVSYKVYIPKRASALARRPLKR